MRHTKCQCIKHSFALLSLAALFWMGSPVSAQSTQTQDHDTTARQLSSFDDFMDGHPVIAEQLRKNSSLARDDEFLKNHPALQAYLQTHPGVREEISENPDAFMRQERRLDAQETRKELTNLDRFMDSHPETAEQLRKNPSLVNNKDFLAKHPELQQFLQSHSALAQELSQNPNAFMQQEERFDQQQGRDRDMTRDRDTTRGQLASMDRFLDSHPEIAEQLRKNPSLVNDKDFVKKHPALQSYLQQNPGVRQEFTENPNAFMHQEQRFDRQEGFAGNNAGFRGDNEQREMANFGQFLGSHESIAQQISKDPSLVNNKEYVENHPQLQEYLKAHPGIQEQASANPQAFMQSMAQVKPAPKPAPLQKPLLKQQ